MAYRVPFTTIIRKTTRDVHAVSDALVNAKLIFALSDNSVWAEGLLIFFEIFHFLEDSMKMLKSEPIGQFFIDGLERTAAFEEDLNYYLGPDWRATYRIRQEVADYLCHLEKVRSWNSNLLIAYVYHLYMGLLSGGQILQRKRQIKFGFNKNENDSSKGYKVTDFGEIPIAELKRNLKQIMNDIGETMSDDEKTDFLAESRKVFQFNNKIIKTVKGTSRIVLQKLVYVALFIVFFIIWCYYIFN